MAKRLSELIGKRGTALPVAKPAPPRWVPKPTKTARGGSPRKR